MVLLCSLISVHQVSYLPRNLMSHGLDEEASVHTTHVTTGVVGGKTNTNTNNDNEMTMKMTMTMTMTMKIFYLT